MYVPLPILFLVAGIVFLGLTSRIVRKRETWLIVLTIIGAVIATLVGVFSYLLHSLADA